MTIFAELVAATNFSFMRGASHPSAMVLQAQALGHAGIGIADRNSVAGVVRAHVELKQLREKAKEEGITLPPFKLIVGARLVFADGTPDIVAYPASRLGWGRLTRLLSAGNLRAEKGGSILRLEDLLGHVEDLLLIVMPGSSFDADEAIPHKKPVAGGEVVVFPAPPSSSSRRKPGSMESSGGEVHLLSRRRASMDSGFRRNDGGKGGKRLLRILTAAAPGRVWLAAVMPRSGADHRRLAARIRLARAEGVPLIATNDALYATPEQRPLHDVLTSIRLGIPVGEVGRALEANAERHPKPAEEMARLFADCPEAVAESTAFLSRVHFDLDQLRYEYPHEPVPEGWEPLAWLRHMVMEAAHARYGADLPEKVAKLLDEEFRLIEKQNYAYYFLTVHDLVRFARAQEPPILCQGRGSAANSIVCFLLGVTSVDPVPHDLLFSRFVSEDRNEPPDIDVDFEHERREEVMQYVYRRYGRHRAGIVATVIHYRPRSAVREVGKALGFSEDVTTRLVSTVWGSFSEEMEERRVTEVGYSLADPAIARLKSLVDQLLMFPRHLSQHVGGFVLTQNRLDETVPIHNGAMEGRTFIEWDKDDIDALGLMKVDVLALGMLTCIAKSFDLMRAHGLGSHSLEVDLQSDDRAVYEMLHKGDSIGVFQVESRAQINMLPHLKPDTLYDLTIQVAIVRPGPIEGDMVHPYLWRRTGIEKWSFPSPKPPHDPDELKKLLGQTYGVPLFQEQAMKLAITAAEFTPSEANQLRRAMATFKYMGTVHHFREKLINGMVRRGYEPDFAERCFKQIEGFGSYGFPESHALSFARLVYVSAWIKCHYPDVFVCAILNSQPMGFYAPAQLVRDAREHGVEVRGIDVNASGWENALESSPGRGGGPSAQPMVEGGSPRAGNSAESPLHHAAARRGPPPRAGEDLPSSFPPGQELRNTSVIPAEAGIHCAELPRIEKTLPSMDPDFRRDDDKHCLPSPPFAGMTGKKPHQRAGRLLALRLGFRQMSGFKQAWAKQIEAAQPFASIEDLARRANLPQRALRLLADADAFRSIGLDRRAALWEVRRTPDAELPLFAAARARELGEEPDMALPQMRMPEHVAADYQTTRLSLKDHPLTFLRSSLAAEKVVSCAEVLASKAGRRLRTAGVVLVRQRPGKGNAIFVTIEDETGITNIILWARLFEIYRREVMASRLMLVEGEVQRSRAGVVHLLASRVIDRTPLLDRLADVGITPTAMTSADEFIHPQHPRTSNHPRNARIIPKSRDFH